MDIHRIKRTLLIMSMLLCSLAAMGQNVSASGTVVDESGAPMIGVGVVQKGTTNGVITDIDGKFSIRGGFFMDTLPCGILLPRKRPDCTASATAAYSGPDI